MALHQLFFRSKQVRSVLKTLLLLAALLVIAISPLMTSFANAQTQENATTAEGAKSGTTLVTVEGFCDKRNPFDWDLAECASMRLLQISSYALIQAGVIFNFFLDLTLDTGLFEDDGVVSIPWTSVKDLANLGFILALIFISFKLIFEGIETSAKKVIVRLIIAALLINFSMFFSRVLIDVGNITALTFKNEITVTGSTGQIANIQGETGGFIKGQDDTPPQDIAGAIIASFNPLRIFKGDVFKSINDESGESQRMNFAILIIFLAMSIIQLMLAWELVKAGFYFISRTIWLVVLTVISPLAFVSLAFPQGKQKFFDKWLKNIIDRCFCVVIFVAAVWLLILMMNAIGDNTAAGTTWQGVITTVVLEFGLVYGLIKLATSQTKKMCEGGMGVGDFAVAGTKKLGGFGLGVATGGAGVLARRTIGGGAFKAVQGEGAIGSYLNKKASEGSAPALFMRNRLKDVSNANFGRPQGFKDKLNEQAKKRQGSADEIENLRTGSEQERIEKMRIENLRKTDPALKEEDAKKKYRASAQYKDDKKVARTAGQRAGTNYLAGQASADGEKYEDKETSTYVKAPSKTGPIRRLWDSSVNGVVPAADEAYKRRTEQIETDKEKKEILEEEKQEQANLAAQAARQKGAIDKAKVRTTAEVVKSVSSGENPTSDTVLAKLDEALLGAYVTSEDKDKPASELIKELMEKQPKMAEAYEKDKKETREVIDSIIKENGSEAEALRAVLDERNELLKASQEEQKDAVEQQNFLAQIQKEMAQNNETADLTNERREVLKKSGINVPDEASFIGPEYFSRVSDAVVQKTNEANSGKEKLSNLKNEVQSSEKALADFDKKLNKEIQEGISDVTRSAKARLDSNVRSGQSQFIIKGNKLDRESDAKQKSRDEGFGYQGDAQSEDLNN